MSNQANLLGTLLAGVTVGLTIGLLLDSDNGTLKREKLVHLLSDFSGFFKGSLSDQQQSIASLLDKASFTLKAISKDSPIRV